MASRTPFDRQQALLSTDKRTYIAGQQKKLARHGLQLVAQVGAAEMVAAAAESASGAVAERLQQINAFYADAQRSRRRALATAYDQVGQEAVKATVRAYDARHKPGDPYRANASGKMRRDAGGKLRSALASPNMYLAGPDGIAFVNEDWLDSRARQWYRLNFGAGSRGAEGDRPKSYRMKFLNQQTNLGVSLGAFQPSAPFRMPAGIFLDGGEPIARDKGRRGLDEFAPANYVKRNMPDIHGSIRYDRAGFTKGIEASNFLDRGVQTIAREFPNVTTEFVLSELRRSIESGGSKGAPAKAAIDLDDMNKIVRQIKKEMRKNKTNSLKSLRGIF